MNITTAGYILWYVMTFYRNNYRVLLRKMSSKHCASTLIQTKWVTLSMYHPFCWKRLRRKTRQEIKYSLILEKSTNSFDSLTLHPAPTRSMIFCAAPAYSISQCGVQAVFWNTKYQERVFIGSNASEYSRSQQWRDVKSTRKKMEYISPSISHWLKKTEFQQWFHPLLTSSFFLKDHKLQFIAALLYFWGSHLAKMQSSPLVCNTFVVPVSY